MAHSSDGVPDIWQNPELLALEAGVEQEMLQSSPTLVDLASVPVGALVRVDIGRPHADGVVEQLAFRLARSEPGEHWQAREWVRLYRGGQTKGPMSLYGACALGGTIGEAGVIKQGVGLTYAQIAVFRSGEEAPEALGVCPELPVPEQLDPLTLRMVMSIGQIAGGTDGLLRWRMPSYICNTGPVLSATVSDVGES